MKDNTGLPFLSIFDLLIKRILEEGFVEIFSQPQGAFYLMGNKMNPDILVITERGKEFIKDFSKNKIGYEK